MGALMGFHRLSLDGVGGGSRSRFTETNVHGTQMAIRVVEALHDGSIPEFRNQGGCHLLEVAIAINRWRLVRVPSRLPRLAAWKLASDQSANESNSIDSTSWRSDLPEIELHSTNPADLRQSGKKSEEISSQIHSILSIFCFLLVCV